MVAKPAKKKGRPRKAFRDKSKKEQAKEVRFAKRLFELSGHDVDTTWEKWAGGKGLHVDERVVVENFQASLAQAIGRPVDIPEFVTEGKLKPPGYRPETNEPDPIPSKPGPTPKKTAPKPKKSTSKELAGRKTEIRDAPGSSLAEVKAGKGLAERKTGIRDAPGTEIRDAPGLHIKEVDMKTGGQKRRHSLGFRDVLPGGKVGKKTDLEVLPAAPERLPEAKMPPRPPLEHVPTTHPSGPTINLPGPQRQKRKPAEETAGTIKKLKPGESESEEVKVPPQGPIHCPINEPGICGGNVSKQGGKGNHGTSEVWITEEESKKKSRESKGILPPGAPPPPLEDVLPPVPDSDDNLDDMGDNRGVQLPPQNDYGSPINGGPVKLPPIMTFDPIWIKPIDDEGKHDNYPSGTGDAHYQHTKPKPKPDPERHHAKGGPKDHPGVPVKDEPMADVKEKEPKKQPPELEHDKAIDPERGEMPGFQYNPEFPRGDMQYARRDNLGYRAAPQFVTPTAYKGYRGPIGHETAPFLGDETVGQKPDEAMSTLRPQYGISGAENAIPHPHEQLRSDLEFDLFSVVPPGYGEGVDNKLYLYQKAHEDYVRFKGPFFSPGPWLGPLNTYHPMPWQWQSVKSTHDINNYNARVANRHRQGLATIKAHGERST